MLIDIPINIKCDGTCAAKGGLSFDVTIDGSVGLCCFNMECDQTRAANGGERWGGLSFDVNLVDVNLNRT